MRPCGPGKGTFKAQSSGRICGSGIHGSCSSAMCTFVNSLDWFWGSPLTRVGPSVHNDLTQQTSGRSSFSAVSGGSEIR